MSVKLWPAVIAIIALFASPAVAQAQPAPPANAAETLLLSGEISLSDFIDYISQRLKVRIIYDDSIRQKKVNLIAPDRIPTDSLWEILQSVLINQGLVITDANEQGFKRITTNAQIPQVARPSEASENLADVDDAIPLTRIFVLDDSQPSKVAELLKPFLSQQGSSVIPIDRAKLLVVTDVARYIARAEKLINIIDGNQTQVEIEFVPAKHVSVNALAEQVGEILAARRKAMGEESAASGGLEISVDARSNSLILIGTKAEIDRTKTLLDKLDQALDTRQQAFPLRYFSPERFDELIRGIIENRAPKPPFQSRVEGSAVIVDSTPEVLQLIQQTLREFDTREAPDSQSPVRFYKIKNVPATELVETISRVAGNVADSPQRTTLPPRRLTSNDVAVPVPNFSLYESQRRGQPVPSPLTPALPRVDENASQSVDANEADATTVEGFQPGFPADLTVNIEDDQRDESGMEGVAAAEVTADVHTNTIIVVAPPEVQRIYASLIEALDQRRPQVLIEAQVVIIDTSDDYSLGVEVSAGDTTGARRLFSFSSYGLSTVDPTTGALAIAPGVGFNGTLVDPSTADIVVRALASHRRARVASVPRILVNDNSEGQLTSVAEVPFQSLNSSAAGVVSNSFAGFAEAGTTITATPTISDDNYLQLDYTVTLNSFTGAGTDTLPPPRQTNEVRSRVTVPDGYTVIVGGLTSKNDAFQIDSIPVLERIPIIRELSSLKTDSGSQQSLFVFLRPVILREDKFKDLRFLSDTELRKAEMETNFPVNQPLMIK